MTTCAECTWLNVLVKGTSCSDIGKTPTSAICPAFRSQEQDLVQIKRAFSESSKFEVFEWLPKDFSKAFMVCIGAGPWKYARRCKIQGEALTWLGDRDIAQLDHVTCYPLKWQNKTVETLAESLRVMSMTMETFCSKVQWLATNMDPALAKRWFYKSCGNPQGFKTLSLFCRDSLKIEAFPIDRHVSRRLALYNLPVDENALVHLCMQAALNVREVAVSFVQTGDGKGLDTGNPDWHNR